MNIPQPQELSQKERKALFDRNIRLAEWCARRYGQGQLSHDDRRQAARIGLWKACMSWSSDGAALSTYALRCIYNEIRLACARERVREYADVDLLVDVLEDTSMPTPEQVLAQREQAVLGEALSVANRVPHRVKRATAADIVTMMGEGRLQSEIAQALGVSRQRIGQVVADVRAEYSRAAAREGGE